VSGRTWIISPTGEVFPGFYRGQMVRGGPLVAIVLAEVAPAVDEDGEPMWDWLYTLTLDGEARDPWDTLGLMGEPCTAAEVAYIEATRQHDRMHGTPMANARKKVDLFNDGPRLF
jgi:hypothetical protein